MAGFNFSVRNGKRWIPRAVTAFVTCSELSLYLFASATVFSAIVFSITVLSVLFSVLRLSATALRPLLRRGLSVRLGKERLGSCRKAVRARGVHGGEDCYTCFFRLTARSRLLSPHDLLLSSRLLCKVACRGDGRNLVARRLVFRALSFLVPVPGAGAAFPPAVSAVFVSWGDCSPERVRAISTARLCALPRLHLQPINVVVSNGPLWRSYLGGGFALRCFQRLS